MGGSFNIKLLLSAIAEVCDPEGSSDTETNYASHGEDCHQDGTAILVKILTHRDVFLSQPKMIGATMSALNTATKIRPNRMTSITAAIRVSLTESFHLTPLASLLSGFTQNLSTKTPFSARKLLRGTRTVRGGERFRNGR